MRLLARMPLIGRFFAPDPALIERLRAVITSRRTATLDSPAAHDAWVVQLARQLGVTEDEIEFLVSAIGSFQRRSVTRGAAVSYDAEHERVFRALDALAAEGLHP